ncbi:MAG: DUF4350 domain-containing protein, partial [Pyrinomonadaceae bacterium]
MKQKLFIFLALISLFVLLIGLNAASYVQKAETPDTEFYPNRSSYNAGSTGTRAFFDLLAETGRNPVRWQDKTVELVNDSANKPQTFVVIGSVRRDFTDEEIEQLLQWVATGGKLVVIDRSPRTDLLSTTANWGISAASSGAPAFGIDPTDRQQMTRNVAAAKPAQPTVFTRNVIAVQPSRFASSIRLESFAADKTTKIKGAIANPSPDYNDENYDDEEPPPDAAKEENSESGRGTARAGKTNNRNSSKTTAAINSELQTESAFYAPVVHLASKNKIAGEDESKNLLADFAYGAGQIVFLADPYIVSNAGISQVDNAQLAINIVSSRGGTIAFDEYHQGFGTNENRFLAYFAGTPIPAILAQIALLIAVILFTQSRRFARPLPAAEPNRLSKLEYVSAMAELQGRTKAYDLAIENIYTEFRRRAAKSFG